MKHAGRLEAIANFVVPDLEGSAMPDLHLLDSVRELLVRASLDPLPETYELFYRHLEGEEPALSRAIELALSAGRLTPSMVLRLRHAHLGQIASGELLALVTSAHDCTLRVASGLDRMGIDTARFEAAVNAEARKLAAMHIPADLSESLNRLLRAGTDITDANRQLEGEIHTAQQEISRLLDRLEGAERATRTDFLTGLLNRRGVMDTLRQELSMVQADGMPLCIAMADIDHFRHVNERWGHDIGDEVLRCVANHLHQGALLVTNGRGVAGRYGGEEFMVVLPGLTLPEATLAMDRMRASLARQLLRRADDDASLGHVSFSSGVARFRADDNADSLIIRSDLALFTAKRAGRDRVLPEQSVKA